MIYSHKDTQIQYDIFGSGNRPVIILHGWGGPEVWYSFIDKLKVNNYQIFLLHLPPFGQSERPPKEPDLDWYTEMIVGFVKYLELSNITIIGHSMGGQIAINTEANHKIAENLILIGSSGIRRFYFSVWLRNKCVKLGKKLASKVGISNERLSRNKLFNKIFSSNDYQNADNYQREVLKNMVNTDIRNQLKSIQTHTLCIWGEEDKESPLINGIEIFKIIKNNRKDLNQKVILKIVSKANHFPFLEYPDTINALTSSFLRP